MSYRTRRGRYPKGSALHQPSNTQMSQQPGTGGMTYSHASEVPFYNVQQTAQIAQKYSSLKRKENVIYTNTPCMPSTTQTPFSDASAVHHHSVTAMQPPTHQPTPHNRFQQPQQQPEYWHENSSHANFNQPETNAWDWTPHTVTETVVSRQPPVAAPPAIFQPQYFRPEIPSSQYQDPNIQQHPSQQQQQLNYQQPPQQQQLSYQQPPHQQQQQLNYQQPPQQQQEQLNYQQPPQQQQQLNYQQPQQQLNYQQPPQQQEQLNHQQPVNNLYNSQNYVSEPLPVSSSYPVQNSWYTPSNGDVGNQDCEQSIPEVQQIDPWEPTIPNISQAQQIQWTYNVPQNTMPSESSWQNSDISTNSVPVNSTHWNHQSANHWVQKEENSSNSIENHHDKNNSMPQDLNSLPVSNTGTLENAQFHSYQDNIENLKTDPVSLNTTYADSVHSISENLYVEEPESGTVNTFFGDSLEENIPIPNEQLPPQIPHLDSLEIGQMEDQMADLSIVQPHTPLISESNDSPSQQLIEETLPDPNSFLQKEVDSEQPEAISFPPSSSTEEPLNQEVPEPHDSQCITPVPRDGVSNQILEEPLNQQVPEKTEDSRPCEGRKPTPERISDVNAIGHREGSPFKPPTKLKNSTAPIVQQESSDVGMESPPKDDIGIHGVNLETLPDNLERPFDQDRPQRQYRSSRLRRCLREGDDESPEKHLDTSSTSLLDSPDIPCITFALAAPPVSPSHSHRTKSSTPPVTDGSEHEDSQSTPVATKSQGIIEIANMNSTPSYEKSSISMAQNESSVTPTPQPVYTKPEPILTIAQPLLIPTLPSLPATPSHSSNRDHDLDVSSSFDQSSEYDQKEERKSDSRRGSFKTSSPIKELKSFEPVPPEKFRHERESQGYSRNYPASEKDDSHSSSSRDQSNRRHYRDYENHAPENREGPVDRNYSRQRFAENRQPTSFDDRAYSDRDGSRPSSRMSLNETGDNRTYRDNGYRKQYASDYERPPSRVSESEAYGSNKRRSHRDYDRDSQYYREEEYYRRQRQYGEYDYDPYAQAGNPYYRYYYPYGYNYNYGFYDELYRNDPRYKQQMEDQYREYYRRLGYETDPERLSVHSGRSSANELARDMRYPEPDGHSNESEYSSYVQQGDTYSEDQHSTPSTRLTPSKFSCPHPIARFSNNGMLITLIPKLHSTEHSAFVEIHDVQVFAQDLETYEELKSYEGPLVRGATHKNDIIDFCLRKIKFYKQKVGIPDRESYILLWELLVLLLRQNGSVAGSDIAELLLKNHEILYPQLNKLEDTTQSVNSPTDGVENPVGVQTGDNSSPDEGIVVARDRTILNANHNMDPDKLIRKYREFLLFGHKKDALEYAVKQGLWSHALFLASKMDMRTYSSVLMRFTNSLTLNDPLQSLYQLMSGRQPTAVTSIADKQWGDWRPHLAMILSNPSSNPENDSKSITTLGDTLAVQGCLPAAHFCYLMAQVEFGYFSSKSSKMVLLGANHLLPFEAFATNEAIQCTEIYEYAQSLANPGFVLNHLQAYKFLYAMNLVDHGLLPEALRYCEVLASSFISSPYSVSLSLITQVYELASKLKFHDPYYLPGSMELEPDEDPEWLKLFSTTLQNLQNNVPYQSDSEDVPSDGTTNAENLKEENDSPQELNNTDIQNQNYYNNESQQNYYNQETQNYYVNNNSWTGENNTIPNNQINTYDNQTTQPNYNQYSNNTQTTQWNLNSQQQKISEQYQGNESIESTTEASPLSTTLPAQPSPPSFTTNKFDFHGTNNNQQERSSALSPPSVSPNSGSRPPRKHRPYAASEDLEMLVRKEETESDTVLFSSSHSTPLHLMTSGDDDKQMLMGHHTGIADMHTLNSCLKSSKFRQSKKSKKSIKFDTLVLNHPGNTREKTKFQHSVVHRRKNIPRKPPEVSGTSDSSPEDSPSKEKKKPRSKMSIFASFGFGKGNEQNKIKTKRKRKGRKKSDTTEKILHSKKTFAIDEPLESDDDDKEWKKENNFTKAYESEQMVSLLEKLSSEQQENTELGRMIASEFKKKPPLIYGGTFPIDEPCAVAEPRKSRRTPTTRTLTVEATNISFQCASDKSSPLSPSKKKFMPQSKNKRSERDLRQPELALRSKASFKMFRRLRSIDKKTCLNKTLSCGADSLTSNSSPVYTKPKPQLVETHSVYSSRERTSSVSSFGYQKDRHDSNVSSGSDYAAGTTTQSSTLKKKPTDDRVIGNKEDKSRQQVGRSWLGGIFNRLLPKAPNQMILPDDKNPTIVWDPVKKNWINTDGSETEDSLQPVAPPTDTELLNQTSSSDIPSSMPSIPSPPSTLMSNRFKRAKGKGTRDYIDVLNPMSPATKTNALPDALFPSPMPLQTQSPQLFIPSGPTSDDRPVDFVSTGQAYITSSQGDDEDASVPDAPIMYDPAEFDSRRSNVNTLRHSVGPARRTYPT